MGREKIDAQTWVLFAGGCMLVALLIAVAVVVFAAAVGSSGVSLHGTVTTTYRPAGATYGCPTGEQGPPTDEIRVTVEDAAGKVIGVTTARGFSAVGNYFCVLTERYRYRLSVSKQDFYQIEAQGAGKVRVSYDELHRMGFTVNLREGE